MHAHLKFQLKTRGTSADAKRNKICLHLIDCIDGDGHLFVDKEEAAQILGVTIHQVENAIQTIQTFDPPGVGARNIGECLAIQLRELGLLTPTSQMLLGGYLLDIANNHFKKVAVATWLDEATIATFKM
ncbi:RNA polymerase factor sigma-54 [Eubacterium aggregans]|uniref:RNA polymerase factor sigma-54 n=1 Tax=Eubacterium aggregans TaxID=81409 RepID=UPI003F35648C